MANGWKMRATGEGKAFCPCIDEHLTMLYVPKLKFNLLSVRALTNIGYIVTFRGDKCIMEKDGKRVTATLEKDVYVLHGDKLQKLTLFIVTLSHMMNVYIYYTDV
uniref:Uncharacterized protein n=1 Tax=Micrurus corallinus TaxID=54390 RepID=A0A2D4ERR4_MICCO